jgi:hypothetical protein
LTPSDVGRETLPEGWSSKETYALRYVHNKDLYILKGTKTEGDIVFNLVVGCAFGCPFVNAESYFLNGSIITEWSTT